MTDRESVCLQVLQTCRAELCVCFPYLDSAFACLSWELREEPGFRVDGKKLSFGITGLLSLYSRDPASVRRGYLHMLLHCLFLHLFPPADAAPKLWDLACDMAVEQLIHGEAQPSLAQDDPVREECFALLGDRVLSAEQMLRLLEQRFFPYTMEQLENAFRFDCHDGWQAAASQGIRRQWEALLLDAAKNKAGKGKRGTISGSGAEDVRIAVPKQYDYRAFLQQFTVPREEAELDPESFDYIFYHFGMEHYGSMPLIEPLEYREVRRLEELVIAIDTSGSCSAEVIGQFLGETYAILSRQENFFRKMKVYFLQCDCLIQDVTLIQSREDWLAYAKKIQIRGRGGTDFSPVFSYVEQLRREKKLKNLKALLYFTDGDGAYPSRPPDYETAFVLLKETGHRELLPKWGKLLLI
ncbi:MAG: VWA-like domain-containing protein [Faecousia sp.]